MDDLLEEMGISTASELMEIFVLLEQDHNRSKQSLEQDNQRLIRSLASRNRQIDDLTKQSKNPSDIKMRELRSNLKLKELTSKLQNNG